MLDPLGSNVLDGGVGVRLGGAVELGDDQIGVGAPRLIEQRLGVFQVADRPDYGVVGLRGVEFEKTTANA